MGNLRTSAQISQVSDGDVTLGVVNRKDLPETPVNFRVTHVFVFNSDGAVLLQYIAKGQRSEGRWGSSVAGYVLAGEKYAEAARRKMGAELGMHAVIPRLILKTSMPDLGATKFITLFEAHGEGPFTLDREQVDRVRFVQPDILRAEVDTYPDRFTATFRHLWAAYFAQQG
ncbi:NUDIX domain-containing protein [Brevundimonas sp. A19_0]|uniref:NUDIX domain-containing protein n=1 Tax=Brevundimonas sp. A19_0 TaxID=2821087 RepID=UPI001ADB2343|nr:NUDIX domain-containing protein [Brevundimonas sp. A19_0]MBO9501192.1 NUDIX domain-containing protein [Brevundimonas sp. A19_0]